MPPPFQLDKMAKVLAATAERLHDNFPYFHPLYAGQMLKPPHPVARVPPMRWPSGSTPTITLWTVGALPRPWRRRPSLKSPRCLAGTQHLGHLSSGGTMANLEALWVAGQLAPGKTILASDQAHYTHHRISGVLKLPFESIPSDSRGRMDLHALRERLAQGDVGTVVATMGTTATGSVDPLPEILALQKEFNFRFMPTPLMADTSVWRKIWTLKRARLLTNSATSIPSSSIRTSMACNLMAAVASCSAIHRLAPL